VSIADYGALISSAQETFFLLFVAFPLKILLLCFWQQRVTCNRFLLQFNVVIILVMPSDLNTVVDKVIFWQLFDSILRPAKKPNIVGSVTLSTLQ